MSVSIFLKAIRLSLCSGELYATGHAAPIGSNPNLINQWAQMIHPIPSKPFFQEFFVVLWIQIQQPAERAEF
jgi:hypothetical protein